MSDDHPRVEVITGAGRRRYWPIEEKLRIVEETLQSGASISAVARRNTRRPQLRITIRSAYCSLPRD